MSASEANSQSIDYAPYFEQLIAVQKGAIGSFKRWTGVLVVIGLAITVLAFILSPRIQALASQIVGIGGVSISALAALPYREIAPRRSRIITYALLKQSFEKFPKLPEEDQKRLRDLADETIRKQI